MLERMRRKGNPSALLVGMQTGEATVENSMEFPQIFCFQNKLPEYEIRGKSVCEVLTRLRQP